MKKNKKKIINFNFFLFVSELSEEWALATNLKDLSGSEDDYEEETEPEVFTVKFLGNTNIESARSEEATAEAVKAIISTAKGNYLLSRTATFLISSVYPTYRTATYKASENSLST